ncbi:MAG: glutamine--fructose-6-phosphate transaminase (isomerizing) [Candidatus Portnoybacteria bacterium]|nr:glutamine--fructose-6-phosphate transaminase (isomerizing) [Candidatus Portnoybacteria bacterium]
MCGIFGYIGKERNVSDLIEGLKRLEYRGYDSAGCCFLVGKDKITLIKRVGRIENLEKELPETRTSLWNSQSRWATHGGVTQLNAHPHYDCKKDIFVVHNGIIENHRELKEKLTKKGHTFISDTDTEVIPHLIEEMRKASHKKLEDAVIAALRKVRGTYGLSIISKSEPRKLIAARNSSPLLVGIGEGEYMVASDASAVLEYTKKVVYLNDGEIAVITPQGVHFTNLAHAKLQKKPQLVEWNLEKVRKGGYPHFMLKEIFEQPESFKDALRGRLVVQEGKAKLGGLEPVKARLREINRLIISAMGTALNAGLVGEYMLEEYAGIPVEVENASEFRYRKPIIDKNTAFLAISQSGETADTLAALREAKEKGALALGIINVVGSTLAREVDAGIYNHAGPEIGVASTKAFTSQLAVLALLTLLLGRQRQLSLVMGKRVASELEKIPALIGETLADADLIKKLAKKYAKYQNFLYLGRKYNLPTAYEGALKLKEISYVHAEGYAAAEMKHGPIALIDENFPSMIIAPQDSVYEKTVSNIEQIKARKGKVIALTTKGNKELQRLADDVIYIPKTLEMLTPILAVIPLQLFAYYIGVIKGCDVDKPRNLAKSVTVE